MDSNAIANSSKMVLQCDSRLTNSIRCYISYHRRSMRVFFNDSVHGAVARNSISFVFTDAVNSKPQRSSTVIAAILSRDTME